MSQELPQTVLHAVIAAAVDTVVDEPFRIVSIEPAQRATSIWSIHGRLQQFDSHRLR